MTTTPEQRAKFPLCGARRKQGGGTCAHYAGMRTDHPGTGYCWLHTGRTENGNKHAAKLGAVEFGTLIDLEPGEALLLAVKISAGQIAYYRSLLKNADIDPFERRIITSQFDSERDRIVRAAKAAADSGIAERQIRLAEAAGAELAQLIGGILDELGLDESQRERLPSIMAEAFGQVERSDAGFGETVRVLDPPVSARSNGAKRRSGKRNKRHG
jgi:hypothetical protein